MERGNDQGEICLDAIEFLQGTHFISTHIAFIFLLYKRIGEVRRMSITGIKAGRVK